MAISRLLRRFVVFAIVAGVAQAAVLAAPVIASDAEGDFNGDGVLDCNDVDALVGEIVAGTNDLAFDLNGDGIVNVLDLDAWLVFAGAANLPSGNPYLPADANLDAFVDGLDFIIWIGNKFTPLAEWCGADFNADGFVDGLDFMRWNEFKFMAAILGQHTEEARLGGTPGDGFPDVYYYANETAAPNGEVRPAGTLSLDTDGRDFVAVLVASPDLTGGCILCDGDLIPIPPPPGHGFTVGWINGSTQWIRTNPLTDPGPVGVFDLANMPGLGGLDFPGIFDGFSVRFASDDGTDVSTNVTVVETPTPVDATTWGAIKNAFQ